MGSRFETGYRPESPPQNLLQRLEKLPNDLRLFADRQYYLLTTDESRHREALALGERFIETAIPFLRQPETRPILAFNTYQEAALNNFAESLAAGTVKATDPTLVRHGSSAVYIRGFMAENGQASTALALTWDSRLQFPEEFSFYGLEGNGGLPGTARFVILSDMGNELGLKEGDNFRTYDDGRRIDSRSYVFRDGHISALDEQFRFIGCLPNEKYKTIPYYIFMESKQMLARAKNRKQIPIPVSGTVRA